MVYEGRKEEKERATERAEEILEEMEVAYHKNTMVVVWVGREDYDEVVKAYSRCDDEWGDEEGGTPRFLYGERSG